jgi:hypothetical protein
VRDALVEQVHHCVWCCLCVFGLRRGNGVVGDQNGRVTGGAIVEGCAGNLLDTGDLRWVQGVGGIRDRGILNFGSICWMGPIVWGVLGYGWQWVSKTMGGVDNIPCHAAINRAVDAIPFKVDAIVHAVSHPM